MSAGFLDTKSNPASRAAAVTPHDTTRIDTSYPIRGLYVGGTGNVRVDTAGGDTDVTFTSVPAGTVLPIQAIRVKSTGTTATNIVAMG